VTVISICGRRRGNDNFHSDGKRDEEKEGVLSLLRSIRVSLTVQKKNQKGRKGIRFTRLNDLRVVYSLMGLKKRQKFEEGGVQTFTSEEKQSGSTSRCGRGEASVKRGEWPGRTRGLSAPTGGFVGFPLRFGHAREQRFFGVFF